MIPLIGEVGEGLKRRLPGSGMERLRSDKDIQKLFSRGQRVQHSLVTLLYSPSSGNGIRVGFCVSKKFGGAVKRNRLKRRLREACRRQLPPASGGAWEVVCLPRQGAVGADFVALCRALQEVLVQAGIVKAVEN
jgi:ribonuclease P protein component